MAGAIEYGSFNVPTSTGNFTVTLTDSGLTPKFAIFWWGNMNAFGLENAGAGNFGLGFTDDTTEYSFNSAAGDLVDNLSYQHINSSVVVMASNSTGTVEAEVSGQATTFGTGQLNLNCNTAPSTTRKVFYMVVAEDSDLSVLVANNSIPTGAGNYSYTGASFTPKLKIGFMVSEITAVDVGKNKGMWSIGMAVSSTERMALGAVTKIDIGKTGKAGCILDEDKVLHWPKAGGAVEGHVDFVSFNSDGFTQNVTDQGKASNEFFILIGGADLKNVDISFQNFPTSTGVQSFDPVSFTPNAMFAMHIGSTTSDTASSASSNAYLGGGDESNESELGFGKTDNYGETFGSMNDDKVIARYDPPATNGSWTLDAEGHIDGFDSAGVNINFTTVNTAIRFGLLLMEFEAAPDSTYTLTANKGSYTLGGKAISLLRGFKTTYSKGSFTLSGKAIDLIRGKTIPLSTGSFTLGGKVVTLLSGKNLSASKGSFTETGKTIDLLRGFNTTYSKGSFTLTGKTVDLIRGKTIDLSKGSFTLGGKDAALLFNRTLITNKGSYSLSGKDVSLLSGKTLDANKGSYTLSGKNVDFIRLSHYLLSLSKGSYTLGGKDVSLLFNRTILSSKGSYVLSGKNADFILTTHYLLSLSKGSYTLDGKDISLFFDRVIPLSKGSYTLSGKDVSFPYDRTISLSKGSYSLDGKNVTLEYGLVKDRTLVYNTRRVLYTNKILIYNGN